MRNIKVPTGNILILDGEKGKIECLSIGDYGKEANIKADFMGLKSEINGVKIKKIMPLSEKWVITISTQYGCSMSCNFCDVPKVGKGINATYNDMKMMIEESLKLHPKIGSTKRLNLHYARMGEPTFNKDVIKISYDLHKIMRPYIGNSMIHPVISTMMPKNNKDLFTFLMEWCQDIKNDKFRGDAGLQLSINSTDDMQRSEMFCNNALSLKEISNIVKDLPEPKGRKYTLNFAITDKSIIDGELLNSLFDSNKVMCKITPIHNTKTCKENSIITTDGYINYYPYKKIENNLKRYFDTLVFIPSKDEEESRITCGNAILSDNKIKV
jgi:23S rRNA (adenine2503-C2)-methyltransferase